MRTWLNGALNSGDYLSVDQEPSDSTSVSLLIFQVVLKERTHIDVKHFEKGDDCSPPLFKITVQKYAEMWGPKVHDDTPVGLDVFIREDPCKVDVLALCGVKPSDRSRLRTWTPGKSDVQCCVKLTNPSELRCSTSLSSADCPALCFIDALERLGFTGVTRQVIHTPKVELQFDKRKNLTSYFRCVIASEYLFQKGCVQFKSNSIGAYYEALLRFPDKTAPNLKDTAYKAMLKGEKIEYAPALDAKLSSTDTTPRLVRKVAKEPLSPRAVPVDSARRSESSSSSSSSSSSGSKSDVDDKKDESDASVDDGFPKKLFGEVLQRKDLRKIPGLLVNCPNLLHRRGPGCTKFRSVHLDIDIHGPKSAELFLGCWMLEAYNMDHFAHRKWRPTVAQVREHATTYGDPGDA